MKNLGKAIVIVVAALAAIATFVGICVGAHYLIEHGHGRPVLVLATIGLVVSAVGLVKADLDSRDRARAKGMVIR